MNMEKDLEGEEMENEMTKESLGELVVNDDDEIQRESLLKKLNINLYPNDFLKRMIEEKGGPINTTTYQTLAVNEESPERKKFDEDTRLDYLLRMKNTLNEQFENSASAHPHGMTSYDYSCIPQERRKGLENYKMKVRRENYVYLNLHPDIDAIMSLFLQKVIKTQPAEPVKFAGEFFTLRGTTHTDFIKLLEDEKKKLKRYHSQRVHNSTGPTQQTNTNQQHVGFRRNSWPAKKLEGANQVKKLGLGPLAMDFAITPPPSRASIRQRFKSTTPKMSEHNVRVSVQVQTETPPKFYCGCKDKGRRGKSHPSKKSNAIGLVPLTEGEEEEGEGAIPANKTDDNELISEEEAFSDAEQ